MLPDDARARAQAAAEARPTVQTELDPHLKARETPPVPYSDSGFEDASVNWAIATDQVCLAQDYPFRVYIY